MKLKRRGNSWVLRRRVPLKYRAVERRVEIWIALGSRSEIAAQREAKSRWQHLLGEWERATARMRNPQALCLTVAQERAKALGYRYIDAAMVARLPLGEVLDRIDATVLPQGEIDMEVAEAVLGLVPVPKRLTDAYDLFVEQNADRLVGMDGRQLRGWKGRYHRPIKSMVELLGNLEIDEIADWQFQHLVEAWRIERPKPPNQATINGRLYRLAAIFKAMALFLSIDIQIDPLHHARRSHACRPRPAFSDDWIQRRFLDDDGLRGLPPEARGLLLGMINTGYRISEGADLMPEEIVLSHTIPHLSFRGAYRGLKTPSAVRRVPLTGTSLTAFRQFPKGFPGLRGDAGLSARLNRYLTKCGLRETPQHTVHSLRHSFAASLSAAHVHDDQIAELLGHSLPRGYGRRDSLRHALEAMESAGFGER